MFQCDEHADGSTVDLAVGELLELQLAENPTTGFRWHLLTDGRPVCERVDDRFAAPSGPPGHGGTHVWQFRVGQPGTAPISLAYRRSWETAAAKTMTLHVRGQA